MAGAPQKYFEKLDQEAFIKQAEEFETRFSSVADSAIRTISIASSTHPWTVYRAGELLKWIKSGEYDKILEEYSGVPCPMAAEMSFQKMRLYVTVADWKSNGKYTIDSTRAQSRFLYQS